MGLSDGYRVGGVDAQESNEFIKQLLYDVMTTGNHELYNILDMHNNFAPHFKGRYLTSNVNITIDGVSKPVCNHFAKFKTRKGRAVTALGVMFNFNGNVAGTTVQMVEDMPKKAWFAEAIKGEPDRFLLAGHMPVGRLSLTLFALCTPDVHFDPRRAHPQWHAELNGDAHVAAADLTLGYVMTDACPSIGDNTPHMCTPLVYHNPPKYIGSAAPTGLAADAPVNIVFIEFFENQNIGIVNGLQKDKVYTAADMLRYSNMLATEVRLMN
ncbi:Metallophos domain-containing protein [Mycena venus]|uniref:Metallophos domain-containing protein n=1 Tax=Mycena venus TaxID=2733690 RepID=A0A8H7D886_9AGAR|nr:Metallophos domain-containing protein [Mycena venus]